MAEWDSNRRRRIKRIHGRYLPYIDRGTSRNQRNCSKVDLFWLVERKLAISDDAKETLGNGPQVYSRPSISNQVELGSGMMTGKGFKAG